MYSNSYKSRADLEALNRIVSFAEMGLLSILKKMKQKEKDVRLLMLYPQLTMPRVNVNSLVSPGYVWPARLGVGWGWWMSQALLKLVKLTRPSYKFITGSVGVNLGMIERVCKCL